MNKTLKRILLGMAGLIVLAGIAFAIPGIRDRLIGKIEQWRVSLFYKLYPPEEVVFIPKATQNVDEIVKQTLQAYITPQVITPTPTSIQPEVKMSPTPDTRPTPTPIPASMALKGVRYESQHGLWNYCAPATLSMALSFWGWTGDRLVAGQYLKPYELDKNVMPYEMQSFVEEKTQLKAALRYGGTEDLLKKLIAAGFPSVIEKGTYIVETTTGKSSWMGHFNVLTGYDDAKHKFIAQDSYYSADYPLDYDLVQKEWRGFNYVFLVIYPSDQEAKVMAVLGDYADPVKSYQIAAQIASDEISKLSSVDQYFAWFNRGTSLYLQQDYGGAARAYDESFNLIPSLQKDLRPWRIMWYETGPYFAYYFQGRYQDVIDLATKTLDAASEPYLEESYYWRARAEVALGEKQVAIDDLRTSLKYHPGFAPSLQVMQDLGASTSP